MQTPATTNAIIVPTGRGGFCCIVPFGCLLSLCATASTGLALLLWHRAKRR
ncbi:MAG: hypothetical protein ACYDAR_05740 [Thermomicrobiales bacterium]